MGVEKAFSPLSSSISVTVKVAVGAAVSGISAGKKSLAHMHRISYLYTHMYRYYHTVYRSGRRIKSKNKTNLVFGTDKRYLLELFGRISNDFIFLLVEAIDTTSLEIRRAL